MSSNSTVTNEQERALSITAIICTHNRYDVLGDAISSLAEQELSPENFEVLVVDNSTDIDAQRRFWRTKKVAKNVRVIFEAVPGLSRARNIGLREAAAPLVAYCDDDALPSSRWLSALIALFTDNAKAGIGGGPVEPIWVFPTERPRWLHKWQEGFLTIVNRGDHVRRLEDNEWLAGTNIAYRRDPVLKAGGFNESLGRIGSSLLSNEELILSKALEKEGWETWYDPNAAVAHRVHASRVDQAWFRRRVSWQAVSDQMALEPVEHEDKLLGRIHNYLSELPPQMRGLRGLFLDAPDSDLFQKQCDAIGALMLLLMASGRDPDPV